MAIDWELLQKVGINAFVVVSVMAGSFWIVKQVLSLGEEHLQRNHEMLVKTIEHHNHEREKWLGLYERYTEKIDRSMAFQREEHDKMMMILKSIENLVTR